jgi:hypothetical protein
MGLRETLREAAAEIFGYAEEREQLLEEGADAKLIARAAENIGWSDVAGGTMQNYFEPTREAREQQIERAYRFFFDDPIIKRSVKIRTNYIFRKGVPKPRYREDPDAGDDDDQGKAKDLIKRFWNDPENQMALTSKKALRECNEEKTVQGNLFFLMFRQEGEPPETEIGGSGAGREPELEPPTMKVTHLRVREVVEIITHPANQKIPVYYKRVFTEKIARFEKKGNVTPYQEAYDVTKRQRVLYYRDWRFEAPTEHEGKPWGPPEELIGEGRVYHVKTNATSDMRFGLSDLQAALKWAQGLNQYMSSRMMVAQAVASIALQAKTSGGPKAVSQVISQLQDLSRTAPVSGGVPSTGYDDGGERRLVRGDQGRTRVAVSNQGANLEPMVQDTGAAGAQIDTQIFKGQISAATGVPVHQLGDSPQAGLSTMASLDAPLQAMIEDEQSDWKEDLANITGYMLAGEGLDPNRVIQKMPPILMRDPIHAASMLTSVMAALDPNGANKEMMRWVFSEVLDAMGDPDTQEILNRVFPENAETPYEQKQNETATQAMLSQLRGAGHSGQERESESQSTPSQKAAAGLKRAAERAKVLSNQGRRGIAPPGEALARANTRREIALSNTLEAEFIEDRERRR